jgi:hypothetical protein
MHVVTNDHRTEKSLCSGRNVIGSVYLVPVTSDIMYLVVPTGSSSATDGVRVSDQAAGKEVMVQVVAWRPECWRQWRLSSVEGTGHTEWYIPVYRSTAC